ncbi:MAG: transposase [Verrucomicrobia bacterium]|nr:transposase [Verrucomicrobiota bacterium]
MPPSDEPDVGDKPRPTTTEPRVLRGYGALRRGRFSQTGSDNFVTGCLRRPASGLTSAPVAGIVREKLQELEAARLWHLRTYVLMPDHFHLLATLGSSGDLSAAMRLFKGPLTPTLRQHDLHWQPNFYDHRLREPDELLPTFLYIFLNPYQAGLTTAGERWPWYYCAPEDWEWFGGLTNEAKPFPEWLK